MGIIKPLPELARSSLRAGIILSDVTRVVEELVYNSLDAGASKISIFIGIGTSYVKVVDNGSGITRDGLVLLGERYVTSKCNDLVDMDAKGRTFGFRGEALASISDVSLVEIITKACGRANGYRKVMKGCKCLYLGIDDDRDDVGTTVVVRDLFYNQPVRRKYMQSSPQKILHAVKKCVLRIALVHSNVSFKIIDSESESNLLCTYPCSSPLSLLRSAFSSEVSSTLHELKIGDGNLKLSGHICSPFDSLAIKAVQYVYLWVCSWGRFRIPWNCFRTSTRADINKRFICKGQIHKLLNQLANRFRCLDLQTDHGFQSRKRSRSQANLSYVLNLDCPGSLYDLTVESSKTFVQFKDWTLVLTFIEEAIQQFWKEKYTCGEPLVRTTSIGRGDQLWKDEDNTESKKSENSQSVKKSRMQSHQASLTNLFLPSEIFTKDDDLLSHRLHEKEQCEGLYRSSIQLNEQQIKMEFSHPVEHFLKSWDAPLAKCSTAAVQNNDKHSWGPDNSFIPEESFFDGRLTGANRCGDNVEDNIFSSVWKEQSPKMCIDVINGSAGSTPSSDFHEFSYDDNIFTGTKPFLRGCSLGRSFPLERALIPSGKLNTQNDIISRTQMQGIPHDGVDGLKHDNNIQGSCSLTLPRVKTFSISQDVDFLSKDFVKSTTYFRDQFAEENISSLDSKKQVQNFSSSYQTIGSPCSPVISNPRELDQFIVKDALERSWRSEDRTPFTDLVDSEEKGCEFNHGIMLKKSNKEHCISSCMNTTLLVDDFFDTRQDLSTFLEKPNQYKQFSPESPDIQTCQKDFSSWRLLGRGYEKAYGSKQLHFGHKGFNQNHLFIERSRRGHSAPPICKRKTSFYALGPSKLEKLNASVFLDHPPHLELGELRHPKRFSVSSNMFVKPCSLDDSLIGTRTDKKKISGIMGNKKEEHIGEISFNVKAPALELCSKDTEDSSDLWIKWQNCCPSIIRNDELHAVHDQASILDISSGFLSLAGNSLVPESINKNFLEDAKVLLQLDKKFIPVVSGGTLAVIDQHAADERIRLEDLREKLLSGEAKTVAYLDAERELMLPEIAYQLLHNYADQVKEWGWICNIHAQDSKSFQRNLTILHKRETVITLMAVPCILGVNLSDLDLLEFLQQLADTDGSSTMPPSVLRVLNSKACRGAIMFGDSLLSSECFLIVEELKQTSLCFQCAHGRPTTVPLVNLEALHKQIRELEQLDDCGSNGMWHGLRRHELSLERTLQRLSSAGCV